MERTALNDRTFATTVQTVPTQADYEALANLRYVLRRFMAFSSSAAHQAGLPPQQLAERLLIAPHSATELVGRLVQAELVVTITDSRDKRRHTVRLTPKADELLEQLSAVHLREIRDMAPRLIETLRALDGAD